MQPIARKASKDSRSLLLSDSLSLEPWRYQAPALCEAKISHVSKSCDGIATDVEIRLLSPILLSFLRMSAEMTLTTSLMLDYI